MAKKGLIQRELKRKRLVAKYCNNRKELLSQLKKANTLEEYFALSAKIQKLPRNSSRIRLRNRCAKTGKPRGFFRFFGLCRNALRELGLDCILPGLTKSSW